MNQINAMRDALEALDTALFWLKDANLGNTYKEMQKRADAFRQAIEQAGKQEPVDAVLLSDMVEGHHPEYGRGLFATDNCVQKFYTNSPTAPAEIDFLQHDDHLRFIQRVLESDAPKSDRDEAAQMVRDIRRSIRPTAPAQPAVPHGWKLAPIEPTEAMVIKFAHVFNVTDQSGTFRPAYRAMLSASPTAPAQQPLTIERIKNMDYRGTLDEHIRAVRMTEAYHGITGEAK